MVKTIEILVRINAFSYGWGYSPHVTLRVEHDGGRIEEILDLPEGSVSTYETVEEALQSGRDRGYFSTRAAFPDAQITKISMEAEVVHSSRNLSLAELV